MTTMCLKCGKEIKTEMEQFEHDLWHALRGEGDKLE